MTRSFHVPLLALLSVLCTAAASAQTVPSPYRYLPEKQSLHVFVGYMFTNPELEIPLARDTVTVEIGPRSAPLFGVRYAYRFAGPISGEASLGFSPSERKVFFNQSVSDDTADIAIGQAEGMASAPLLLAEAGVRLHLTGERTWRQLAPFVAASGGLVTDVGGTAAVEDSVQSNQRFDFGPSFAVSGGIGTDWFPTRRVSLRVEVRDMLWKIQAPEGLSQNRNNPPDRWTQNIGVILGGAVHF